MKTLMIGAMSALALLCGAAPASAGPVQDGDDYTFDLVNGSSYTILTFQTARPGGTFSEDWMPQRILESGDTVAMRFNDYEDACVYWVKITFTDGDSWQDHLNFCELETVLVSDDGIEAIE